MSFFLWFNEALLGDGRPVRRAVPTRRYLAGAVAVPVVVISRAAVPRGVHRLAVHWTPWSVIALPRIAAIAAVAAKAAVAVVRVTRITFRVVTDVAAQAAIAAVAAKAAVAVVRVTRITFRVVTDVAAKPP